MPVTVRVLVVALGALELDEFAGPYIGGRDLPAARSLLVAAGFEERLEAPSLTDLGLDAQYLGPAEGDSVTPVVVTAVDTAGPAARAGVRVGDRILDTGPRRGNPPTVGAVAPAHFRYGLTAIPSGVTAVALPILRDGAQIVLTLEPRLVRGGERRPLHWSPERQTGFFDPLRPE